MANLLLPVDFSANARNAAEHAIRLFGPEGNTFHLVHAYLDPNMMDASMPSMNEALRVAAQEGMTELVADLHGRPGLERTELRTEVRIGVLPAVLADLVDELSPRCIAMGTQGASGLQATLFGSNTADVIRRSTVPVLAIPEEAVYRPPARIILADDGGAIKPGTLDLLLDIARWSRSEIKIVRVLEEGADPEQTQLTSSYDDLLGAVPHSHHVMSADNVTTVINDLADQSDADLVVMVHRHLGFFNSLFHASATKRLVMHSHVPLLVLEQ
jgi:nucleotide-binding universal stress UspA family protein